MQIDWWTLGLQTVNFAVLIWLLAHFFWKPIAAILEERQTAAGKLLKEAEAARAESEATRASIEETRNGFAREHDAIVSAAQDEADKVRVATLEDAKKEAERIRTNAEHEIDKLGAEARATWSKRASELAVDIAGRLASRLNSTEVSNAFLDWLLKDLRDLPETVRQSITTPEAELEIVTSTPLSDQERESYQKRISEALGAEKTLSFTSDPKLVAGIALRGPNLVAESSWRADLRTILKELDDDQRP